MGLGTPISVRKLQRALYTKAKAESGFRFYTLWDKVWRTDVLREAWDRCRANGGSPGVDGERFADINARGVNTWLENLRQELRTKQYRPQPLLRTWIPKTSGGERPLGIPTIRDRVVQSAMVIAIGPIFEADLPPQQYGFRPKLDAKLALRRVYFHITQHGRSDVVDADLSDYFNTIPHGALMKCVARRIADRQVLSVIKMWLSGLVIDSRAQQPSSPPRVTRMKIGTPQGGVISPLLSNIYFRRFIVAWEKLGAAAQTGGAIVNYADDYVICCPPGKGEAAMSWMRKIMEALQLTVNERKTRLVRLPKDRFDFLGYTVGRFYGQGGRDYLGTAPSKKSVQRVCRRIHEETSNHWLSSTVAKRVKEVNAVLRGWCNYFNQGPVANAYKTVRRYTERRFRRWLMAKYHKGRGTGYRQYSDEFLYDRLGLYHPVWKPRSPS